MRSEGRETELQGAVPPEQEAPSQPWPEDSLPPGPLSAVQRLWPGGGPWPFPSTAFGPGCQAGQTLEPGALAVWTGAWAAVMAGGQAQAQDCWKVTVGVSQWSQGPVWVGQGHPHWWPSLLAQELVPSLVGSPCVLSPCHPPWGQAPSSSRLRSSGSGPWKLAQAPSWGYVPSSPLGPRAGPCAPGGDDPLWSSPHPRGSWEPEWVQAARASPREQFHVKL